jgi:hypothetical protein
MRTHIFIALGSTLLMLLSIWLPQQFMDGGDPGRIAAQVVSGIGFLGAVLAALKPFRVRLQSMDVEQIPGKKNGSREAVLGFSRGSPRRRTSPPWPVLWNHWKT